MLARVASVALSLATSSECFRVVSKRNEDAGEVMKLDLDADATRMNLTRRSVPVFTMLPLTTIVNNGMDVNPDVARLLDQVQSANIAGFMVDVWWGLTEPSPGVYNFEGYRKLFRIAKSKNWKVQIVASFHQCGGNVGDDCFIPIPRWLSRSDGAWFKDQYGIENYEYISFWADEVKMTPQTQCLVSDSERKDCGFDGIDQGQCVASGCCWAESTTPGAPWCFNASSTAKPAAARTPIEMYSDWMQAFESQFSEELSDTIVEVMVGMGPAGELRYPSYPLRSWNFCGIGEFQCFDQHALASLKEAASARGNAAWSEPFRGEDVGNYNSRPPSSTRFFDWQYRQEHGAFFLQWYFDSLKDHGYRVLSAAKGVFGKYGGVHLAGKIAGIHWWYGESSHAAEVTAGYYNTNSVNAYAEIAKMFKSAGDTTFCFTCLEMTNNQAPECQSLPYSLVRQTAEASKIGGVAYAGENALPTYDRSGYDQILSHKGDLSAFTVLRLNPTLVQGWQFDEFKRFVYLMMWA